jgi:GNAT superfamily N-acetyltransferase
VIDLAVRDAAADHERAAVLNGILAYNREVGGLSPGVDLVVMARAGEAFAGGLIGETGNGTAFIELLYVAEPFRGTGLGSRLLDAAEEEARRRGMAQVYLDTFTFQAPGFYAKRGYVEFGRLTHYSPGHDRTWLRKAL